MLNKEAMMSERKLTDAYWIEVGVLRERIRVLDVIQSQVCGCMPDCDRIDIHASQLIELVEPDSQRRALHELQRLSEKTGEHEHFDNPLIDKDD
jgi:hypothetical protein